MSSHRLPLLPDPDKWVSANKVERSAKGLQRPLVDPRLRAHAGIATPPSSTAKRRVAAGPTAPASGSAAKKRRVPDSTPTATIRGIDSYMTPPTTGGPQSKKRVVAELATSSTPRTSQVRRSPGLDRDRAASVSAWREALPPPPISPVKPSKRSSAAPSPNPYARHSPTTPEAPSLSLRQLTPVPASVLARHQRLCGQDSARRRAAVSPWRREHVVVDEEAARAERDAVRKEQQEQRAVERERKRQRLDAREAVDENAILRVQETRYKRALGESKTLAHLSSDRSSSPRASSPSERAPLASKDTNALRRHSSAVVEPVCSRDKLSPPRRQHRPRTAAYKSRAFPSAFPDRPRTREASPELSPARPTPTRAAPGSTTPRKRRVNHHHVTPPKSRTPQRRDHQETLFEFSAPPKQPVFKPASPSPKPVTEWRPVQMEAETLITWSLGGGGGAEIEPAEDAGMTAAVQHPESDNDDVDSIAPSIPSQSFPILFESSSPNKSSSPDKSSSPNGDHLALSASASLKQPLPSSDSGHEDSGNQPSSPSPSKQAASGKLTPRQFPAKPLVRHSEIDAGKRRRGLDHALFSSLSQSDKNRTAIPALSRPPTQRRTKHPSSSQSKLEAFGYFRSGKLRETRDFETAFSDEEDLDFGDDGDPSEREPDQDAGLQPVPMAPPHPSLRPSGMRELARRDDAAMERHRAQRDSLSSSDRSPLPPPPSYPTDAATDLSSSQTDDGADIPRISESARAWWDKLGRDEGSDDLL